MGPKPVTPESDELFVSRLDELINVRHPLVCQAGLIDWDEIERTVGARRDRPALPPRLLAGLLYLQHAFDASDEAMVSTWVDIPIGNTSATSCTCRPTRPSTRAASRA
ncbi:hypothetical protein [Variovorax sp. N23]|uniref:hypothetical protein n=1 Tax=Variovorax sp. N23 TaxID=2980555 RepID=UPI003966E758